MAPLGTETYQPFRNDIKGFLLLGNILGVVPVTPGTITGNIHHLKKQRCIDRLLQFFCWTVTIALCIRPMYSLYKFFESPKRNAFEIADAIKISLGGCFAVATRLYFFTRKNELVEFFQIWKLSKPIVFTKVDNKLQRDILPLLSLIFVSAILENALLHQKYFSSDSSQNPELLFPSNITNLNLTDSFASSILETYYKRGQPEYSAMFPYHWAVAIFAFIEHKWLLYGWNYLDAFIIIMARIFYFKFQAIYEIAESKLLGPGGVKGVVAYGNTKVSSDKLSWMQLANDHKVLCRLLNILDNFMSPLVFGSYLVNVFYICIALFYGLAPSNQNGFPEKDAITSVHRAWSTLHLLMRTLLVSIYAARINKWANKIIDIVQECPAICVSEEIRQLERRITNGPPVGFTGLGCFVVTKPFILTVISVVFTFEIVLLQCVPTHPGTFSPQGYF